MFSGPSFKEFHERVQYRCWSSFIIHTLVRVPPWNNLRLTKFKDATYTTQHRPYIYLFVNICMYMCIPWECIATHVYRLDLVTPYIASCSSFTADTMPTPPAQPTLQLLTHTHRHWNAIQVLRSIYASKNILFVYSKIYVLFTNVLYMDYMQTRIYVHVHVIHWFSVHSLRIALALILCFSLLAKNKCQHNIFYILVSGIWFLSWLCVPLFDLDNDLENFLKQCSSSSLELLFQQLSGCNVDCLDEKGHNILQLLYRWPE